MTTPDKGILMVVSAPSGAGKTSVCREVLREFPEIRFSISYTTRPRRPGETEGIDYFFVPEEEFRRRIGAGWFVEWTEHFGYYYGTSRRILEETLNRGCDLMLDIDTEGAKKIREAFPEAVFVFILPPSMEILRERLEKRGSEQPEALEKRMRKAYNEIREVFRYDYAILNDRIPLAVERLKSVYIAEKCRSERLKDSINKVFGLEESNGKNHR
ncbi:MAG TPA: guanylate kinase [Syntrophales bacterium]|nr:guanylate kinase [Syntrophales bacterium]